MNARVWTATAALAVAASGCSGGGATIAAHHGSGAASGARAPVGFTMRWPSRAVRAKRRASFVSPSTLSVVVEVNPDAATVGPVTFANNPQIAGGTSTVTIDAPVGADIFIISLYDQPQIAGETTATGNELGRVSLAQTVVANTTNTLAATVIGTVASVRIGPLPNQSNVVAVSAANPPAYELVGRAPAVFTVAPLDVDGNVILQPDAPPAIALAPNVRGTGALSVTPVSGTSDRFTVQAVAPNLSTYPTSLVATASDANGSLATSSTIVDVTSAVYVAYANGGTPAVARFDPFGNVMPLAAGAFAGLANPVALAYDAVDREILVADAGLGKVLAFDENGVALGGFAAPAVPGVNGIAYDPHDGDVYASGSAGVTVFAPDGGPPHGTAPTAFPATNAQGIAFVATSPFAALNRIAAGDASAPPQLVMFSENGNAAGGAALAATPIALAYGAPVGITQSPSTLAQLYVTSANGVAALDPGGAPVASIPDAGGPFGIVIDPNLREPQVAERGANALTTYLNDLSAVDPARSFATPASLNLTQPQGVCDVF